MLFPRFAEQSSTAIVFYDCLCCFIHKDSYIKQSSNCIVVHKVNVHNMYTILLLYFK